MFRSWFGGKSSQENEKIVTLNLHMPEKNEQYRLPYFFPGSIIYLHDDKIAGTVKISANRRTINYESITISILGQYRIKSDGTLSQFCRYSKQIAATGSASNEASVDFSVRPADCQIPSFYGTFVDARYLVQATVKINGEEHTDSVPIYLLFAEEKPDKIVPFKAEVGIQNVLHVELVIQNPMFCTSDCIIGRLNFLVVKIRITNIYLQIKRQETFNNGIVSFKHDSIIAQHELLDGIPVRGDSIPIRYYMAGVKAWPYPKNSTMYLNVDYAIRLLLVDENGKHYYKDLSSYIPCFRKDEL